MNRRSLLKSLFVAPAAVSAIASVPQLPRRNVIARTRMWERATVLARLSDPNWTILAVAAEYRVCYVAVNGVLVPPMFLSDYGWWISAYAYIATTMLYVKVPNAMINRNVLHVKVPNAMISRDGRSDDILVAYDHQGKWKKRNE